MERSTLDDGALSEMSMSSQESITTQFQIPQFTLPLHDTTIRESEELKLKCIVLGEPMPTIRWTYNGEEIRADDRLNILVSANLTSSHPFFSLSLS